MGTTRRLIIVALLWTLVTAIGSAVGLFVGTLIGFPLATLFNPLGLALVGAILGAVLGLGQWLVLRRSVPWARRWVLVSTLGGLGGFLLGFVLASVGGLGNVGHGLALGGGLGLAQWSILRRVVRHAAWWIVVSSGSWGFIWSFGIGIFASGGMVRLAGQSLVYGLSTALLLVWFLHTHPDAAVHSAQGGRRSASSLLVAAVVSGLLLFLGYRAGAHLPRPQSAAPRQALATPHDPTLQREVQLQVNRVLLEATIVAATGVAVYRDGGSTPATITAVAGQYQATHATVAALRPTARALTLMLVPATVQPTSAAEATLVTRAREAASGSSPAPDATPTASRP